VKALIVRELRALRNPALAVGGVALALVATFAATLLADNLGEEATGERLYLLFAAWTLLLPVVALALGCRSIAGEQARGEVEFSATWPVSRDQVWLARSAVALGALAALAGAGWLCVWAAAPLLARLEAAGAVTLGGPFVLHAVLISAGAVALLGLGTVMSAVRATPFDAMGASLLAATLLIIGLGYGFLDFVPQRWGPQIGLWPLDVLGNVGAYVAFAAMFLVGCMAASWLGFTHSLALQFGRRTWLTLGAGVGLTLVVTALLPMSLWLFGEPTAANMGEITWAQTSPDGRWVCFEDLAPRPSFVAQRPRLWIVRSDGSGLRCIARRPVDRVGEWDAQRWLPFAWGTPGREAAGRWLWVWDMERMAARKLPHPPDSEDEIGVLSVSPDGSYLVGAKILRLGDEIRKIDAQLAPRASFAGWAADGRRLFFRDNSGGRMTLRAMALPGGGLEQIALAPSDDRWDVQVSPDGRWVAWSGFGGRFAEVGLQGIGNGRMWPLVDMVTVYHGWSPDGRYVWVRSVGESWFHAVRLGDPPIMQLVRTPGDWRAGTGLLHWSVDGIGCAFEAGRGPEGARHVALFAAAADGGGLRKLAEAPQKAGAVPLRVAGWTHDGRILVVEDNARLVAIDPDSGAREVIFEAPNAGYRVEPADEQHPTSGGG